MSISFCQFLSNLSSFFSYPYIFFFFLNLASAAESNPVGALYFPYPNSLYPLLNLNCPKIKTSPHSFLNFIKNMAGFLVIIREINLIFYQLFDIFLASIQIIVLGL